MTPAQPAHAGASSATTDGDPPDEDWAVRVLRWFATTLPVVLVALVVTPLVVRGGSLWPWQPVMAELGTMITVATQMVDGQVVFGTPTTATFAWTPFGALLLAPLALSSPLLWQVALVVATVCALQHVLSRLLGLRGRDLVLAGVLVVTLVEPVRMTLGVGQISVLLMLLVVVDLTPPVRVAPARRRLLPAGVLTGIATGVALFPVWVLFAVLWSGRRRVALTGLATAAACLLLGWIVMPGQSEALLEAEGRSAGFDVLSASNQSLATALARWGVPGNAAVLVALGMAVLGVWAASRWWQRELVVALGLAMVAGLMPLNPAWTWQFVGVVVLGAGLLRAWPRLPRALTIAAVVWAGWTSLSLPQLLASSSAVPGPAETLLAGIGPLLGVILVAVAALTAPRRRDSRN